MKTLEQIEKSIRTAERHIESHKEQIILTMSDDFDIEKIEEYSRKIKFLEVEIDALRWVVGSDF